MLTLGSTVTIQSTRSERLAIILQVQPIRLDLQSPLIVPEDIVLGLGKISVYRKGRRAVFKLAVRRVLVSDTSLRDDGEPVVFTLDG